MLLSFSIPSQLPTKLHIAKKNVGRGVVTKIVT